MTWTPLSEVLNNILLYVEDQKREREPQDCDQFKTDFSRLSLTLCLLPPRIGKNHDDVLKSPGTAEHSFVWQKGSDATSSTVERFLEEELELADPAKRQTIMKDVPVYHETGRTPVYNAPFG